MKDAAPHPPPTTVDAYIAAQPPAVRARLEQLRATIRHAAPAAAEKLSYRMPHFALGGPLVYYGAFQSHIGFYPPVRDAALQREAAPYANERGNLRFPHDQPLPLDLVARIVAARVDENRARAAARNAGGCR